MKLSRDFTKGIKGLGIIMVFAIHCMGQLGVEHVQFVAAVGVSLFLIISGYGIECSYRDSGLKLYWLKRILTVMVPYWIVQVVAYIYFEGEGDGLVDCLLMIKGNWYVPYIMMCYLIFWASARISELLHKDIRILLICILFFLWFVVDILLFPEEISPVLRSRQMLCFLLGIGISNDILDKLQIVDKEKMSNIKVVIISMALFIFGFVMTFLTQRGMVLSFPLIVQAVLSLFTVLPMAVGMLLFLIRFSGVVSNKFFGFFGFISYELFLVHWQVIDQVYWEWYGIRRFIIFTLVGTTALVLVDNIIINKLKKLLSKK